jgi:hypothetical protein
MLDTTTTTDDDLQGERKVVSTDKLYADRYREYIDSQLAQIAERQKKNFGYTSIPRAPSPDEQRKLADAKAEREKKGEEAYHNGYGDELERQKGKLSNLDASNADLLKWRNRAENAVYMAKEGSLWNPLTFVAKCADPIAKIALRIIDAHDEADAKERTKMKAARVKKATSYQQDAQKKVDDQKIKPIEELINSYNDYESQRDNNGREAGELQEALNRFSKFEERNPRTAAKSHSVDGSIPPPKRLAELTILKDKEPKFDDLRRAFVDHNRKSLQRFLSTDEWEKGIISIQQPSMVPTITGRILPSGRSNDQSMKL